MSVLLLKWPPVRTFWSCAVFAYKALFAWFRLELWLVQLFALPFFQIAFFVYLARFTNPGSSVQAFVAVGNAMQVAAYSSVFAVCNLTSEEKWQGTLTQLMATPANRFSLFVGRSFFQVLNSLATVCVAFIYASSLFGVNMRATNWLALVFAVVITAFAMTGFGLMLGSFGLYLRTARIIANIFVYAGLILCGVNFPVTSLPAWIQPLSYSIPMTYGTIAARQAVSGFGLADIGNTLLEEIVVGFCSIMVGYVLFSLFEQIARTKGTLEKY